MLVGETFLEGGTSLLVCLLGGHRREDRQVREAEGVLLKVSNENEPVQVSSPPKCGTMPAQASLRQKLQKQRN